MRPDDPRRHELGLTLVEQLFVLAMVGFMLVPVMNYLRDTRNSLLRSENQGELLRRNVRIGSNLRTGLSTTDLLLARYSAGPDLSDLRTRIKNSVPAVVAFSTAPMVENATEPKLLSPPSATSDSWGNELMYLANLNPVTFTVCYTGCVGAPTSSTLRDSVSVDRMQFVYIYLAQDPNARLGTLPGGGLRLVEWRSRPFISYGAISQFTDVSGKARLTESVKYLSGAGYNLAFDKDNPTTPEDAFYRISPTGATLATMVDNTVVAPSTFSRSSWAYVDEYDYSMETSPPAQIDRGRISRGAGGGQVSGPGDVMVALNTFQPTTSATWKLDGIRLPGKAGNVPQYATGDLGTAGFPAGFEVSVWGRPSARIVVLRRVLISVSGADRKAPPKTWPGHESIDYVSVKNDY